MVPTPLRQMLEHRGEACSLVYVTIVTKCITSEGALKLALTYYLAIETATGDRLNIRFTDNDMMEYVISVNALPILIAT